MVEIPPYRLRTMLGQLDQISTALSPAPILLNATSAPLPLGPPVGLDTARAQADALKTALRQVTPPLHPLLGATRSGLPWPSGIYTTNAHQAEMEEFIAWRGRDIDAVMWFATNYKWSQLTSYYPPYLTTFPGLRIMSYGLLLVTSASGDIEAAATGANNKTWEQVGQWLHDHGADDGRTVIRLGWEFNGNWYRWSAFNPLAWAVAYCHAVDSMRKHAPNLLFSWCANKGTVKPSYWLEALPDDDHVDIYGIDPYDHYSPTRTEADWTRNCRAKPGIYDVLDLARAHGKKVSIEEWACSSRFAVSPTANYDGGGDNPFYVQKMWDTLTANADMISHELAFDANGIAHHERAAMPLAWAKYRELWGGKSAP